MSECRSSPSDLLLGEIAGGNRQALDELLDHYRAYVRKIVDGRLDLQLRRRIDPSDVVQESMLVASRRIDDFLKRRPTSFRLWLRDHVIQQIVDTHRRHNAQKRDIKREAPQGNLSGEFLVASFLGTKASEVLQRQELIEKVEAAMSELSELDREILILRYVEGHSNADVAEILGMEPRNASNRHGRVLRKLGTVLSQYV